MNVVMIIPTGIGCEIGGHAGDANPIAKLLSSVWAKTSSVLSRESGLGAECLVIITCFGNSAGSLILKGLLRTQVGWFILAAN